MSKGPTYKEIPIGSTTFAGPGVITQLKTGSWRSYRPVIDNNLCIGCGLCEIYCPEVAIKSTDGGYAVDYTYCKGCGICANECQPKAIEMVREEL